MRGDLLQYNLKIKEFANDISVNYYDVHIRRNGGMEEDDKRVNKASKQCIGNNISNTWNNPKTGKVEVIPEGFRVTYNPFEECEYLFPEDRFLTEDVFYGMEFEELLPIVQKGLEEERRVKDFSNVMRSLRRTKQNIYTIARGSRWDLFVTLTIADNELRNDLDKAKKYVGKYINNLKNRSCPDLKYLLVFERHPTSGAWHIHGLFKDIHGLKLKRAINPHTEKLIVKNEMQVYNMPQFDKLGFSTATYVQSNDKVTQYILKYITKEMAKEFPGKRSYLCSKGLPRGTEVLFDIEKEEDIPEMLEKVFGYVPEMTHGKVVRNIYTDSDVKYMQYRK